MGNLHSVSINLEKYPGAEGVINIPKGYEKVYISGPKVVCISEQVLDDLPGYVEVCHRIVEKCRIVSIYMKERLYGIDISERHDFIHVYYWAGDHCRKRPLIIQTCEKTFDTYYCSLDGIHWTKELSKEIAQNLLGYLDKLNCKLYNVHVVDLLRKNHGIYKCFSSCKRIMVVPSETTAYYFSTYHTVGSSITRFSCGSKSQKGLPHPSMIDSVYVYFDFYTKEVPVLVYFEPIKNIYNGNRWYKRDCTTDNKWVPVNLLHDAYCFTSILNVLREYPEKFSKSYLVEEIKTEANQESEDDIANLTISPKHTHNEELCKCLEIIKETGPIAGTFGAYALLKVLEVVLPLAVDITRKFISSINFEPKVLPEAPLLPCETNPHGTSPLMHLLWILAVPVVAIISYVFHKLIVNLKRQV